MDKFKARKCYVQRNIVPRSRKHCVHGNATPQCVLRTVDMHITLSKLTSKALP